MISVCIPTLNAPNNLLFPTGEMFEVIYSSVAGVGAARKDLMERSRGQLVIMIDDDITPSQQLIQQLTKLPVGYFAMAVVDGHVSTRVFAIHRCDYRKTDGFDETIKYVFEDGAFYSEALSRGLKFYAVTPTLFAHKNHVNRCGDYRWLKSWFEHSKMLVKYKHTCYPGLVGFFGLRSVLKQPQVFFVKFFGVIYWIIKGVN